MSVKSPVVELHVRKIVSKRKPKEKGADKKYQKKNIYLHQKNMYP